MRIFKFKDEKKIYDYFVKISLILVSLAVKTNSYKLCAFLIWLNIRKLKIIKSSLNKQKKVLVFPKSNGTEDLIETFKNKKTNFIFFVLPRSFIKEIYSHYFEEKHKRDYFTKLNKSEDIKKKNLYVNFLTLVFKSLNSFIKIDGYISFNIFYFAEKYFEEACLNLNSKFIILHKESTLSALEELKAEIIIENITQSLLVIKFLYILKVKRKYLLKVKSLKEIK